MIEFEQSCGIAAALGFWQPFLVGTFDAVCDGTLGARAAAMDQLWTAMG